MGSVEIKQRQVIIGNCFTRSRLHLVSLGVHRVRPTTDQLDSPPYPTSLSMSLAIEKVTTDKRSQTFTTLNRACWVSDSLRARRLTELEAHEPGHCYSVCFATGFPPRSVLLHRFSSLFFKFPSTHFSTFIFFAVLMSFPTAGHHSLTFFNRQTLWYYRQFRLFSAVTECKFIPSIPGLPFCVFFSLRPTNRQRIIRFRIYIILRRYRLRKGRPFSAYFIFLLTRS